MPEFSAEKPHAISCIKTAVRDLLRRECGDDLTVSCDRADCWSDRELFKFRQAVNIVVDSDSVGEQVQIARGDRSLRSAGNQTKQCAYEATLNLSIEIYTGLCDCDPAEEDCDCFDSRSKGYSILAHITHILTALQAQIPGRRVRYSGSFNSQDDDNDTNFFVITASFQIHYIFDPTRPWVVG